MSPNTLLLISYDTEIQLCTFTAFILYLVTIRSKMGRLRVAPKAGSSQKEIASSNEMMK